MDIQISVSLNKLFGDNQQGTISTILTQPLIIKATYANGIPVNGLPISFTISTQPQYASGAKLSVSSATTNTNGQAQTTLTLGDKSGTYQVTASHPNLTNSPLVFTAIGDNWKTYNYTWESSHDYQNNFTNTWIISHPGASKMQVHFEKYNIVSPDKLFVLDKDNNEITSYSGSMNAVWSPIVVGNVIKLKLVTNNKDTAYGFRVDRYMASDGSPFPQDTTPPAGITDLTVSAAYSSIKLTWTAGDRRRAMFYDIRYSTLPINDSNWANADQFRYEPVPGIAGTTQNATVADLSYDSLWCWNR